VPLIFNVRYIIMIISGIPTEREPSSQKYFLGSIDEIITLMATVIAYPSPTATWDHNVMNYSIVPIDEFTFIVSAEVVMTDYGMFGNYTVTIDNGSERDLVLNFQIQSAGNGFILYVSIKTINSYKNMDLSFLKLRHVNIK